MASALYSEDLTCSVCLSLFTDPVTVPCGHSFCRQCITDVVTTQAQCPQCRTAVSTQTKCLPTSVILRSLAEKAREAERTKTEVTELCPEHEEKLKLFCITDQQLACVICRDGAKHKGHSFKPIKEAAASLRKELETHVQHISDDVQAVDSLADTQRAEMRKTIEKSQQLTMRISRQFEEMHQFLRKREDEIKNELRHKEEDDVERMSEVLNSIETALSESRELEVKATSALEITDPEKFLKSWTEENKEQPLRRPEKSNLSVVTSSLCLGPYESHLQFFVWKEMLQVIQPRAELLSLRSNNQDVTVSDDGRSFSTPKTANDGRGLFVAPKTGNDGRGLFGAPKTANDGQGLFGAPKTANDDGRGLFGTPQTANNDGWGLFGAPKTANDGQGLFGAPKTANDDGRGLFGAPKTGNDGQGLFGAPKTANDGQGLFGAPKTANDDGWGLFGAPKTGNDGQGLFGAPKTANDDGCGLFGAPKTGNDGQGLFGAPKTANDDGRGLFGTPKTANNDGWGLFGAPKTANDGQGLFGAPKTANDDGWGLFGAPKTGNDGQGLFGAPKTANDDGCGLFGAPKTGNDGQGLFGAPKTANDDGRGLFGTPKTANNDGWGLFGAPKTANDGQGLFGAPKTANDDGRGLFGAPKTANDGQGLFGAPKTANDDGRGLFGTPQTANNDGWGLFGAPKTANDDGWGLFGAPKTANDDGRGLFGAPKTGNDGQGLFGAPKTANGDGRGLFGAPKENPCDSMLSFGHVQAVSQRSLFGSFSSGVPSRPSFTKSMQATPIPLSTAVSVSKFTSEQHYWEVEVGKRDYWELGIKDHLLKYDGQTYTTCGPNMNRELPFEKRPRKIGIYLNCLSKKLSFYDADDMTHIGSVTSEHMSLPVSACFHIRPKLPDCNPVTVCWY